MFSGKASGEVRPGVRDSTTASNKDMLVQTFPAQVYWLDFCSNIFGSSVFGSNLFGSSMFRLKPFRLKQKGGAGVNWAWGGESGPKVGTVGWRGFGETIRGGVRSRGLCAGAT